MRIGSLFSGIGGLELGLEWAGVGHTVWQVEQDAARRKRLALRWPDAQRFVRVERVGAHNLPWVEVICGGFPCQDVSSAGKGLGIDRGRRSGLWFEFARVLREMGPWLAVVENPPALLIPGRGMHRVLGELAEAGYDAEWEVLSAQAVGAWHLRKRVFIIAWQSAFTESGAWPLRLRQGEQGSAAADPRGMGEGEPPAGMGAVPLPERDRLEGKRQARAAKAAAYRSSNGGDRGWWDAEPGMGRVAHGVPHWMDRLAMLGDAVVPQVAEVIGRRLLQIAEGRR